MTNEPVEPTVSRRRFLATTVSLPILAAAGPLLPAKTKTPAATFVQHGPRTLKHVALTFHGAGTPALAHQVINLTKKMRASITVFAIGNWVDAHPELAKALIAGGHELGNHTYSHPALRRLGRPAVAKEIAGAASALERATGSIGMWFRPSGTPTPTTMMLEEAAKAGYSTIVGYDVDPLDYQDPGSALIVSRTLATAKPGSIVSLHLGHQGTADALGPIVTGLRANGLELATVSSVLRG